MAKKTSTRKRACVTVPDAYRRTYQPKYIALHLDKAPFFDDASDEVAASLVRAVLAYARTREVPQLNGIAKTFFQVLRADIDTDMERAVNLAYASDSRRGKGEYKGEGGSLEVGTPSGSPSGSGSASPNPNLQNQSTNAHTRVGDGEDDLFSSTSSRYVPFRRSQEDYAAFFHKNKEFCLHLADADKLNAFRESGYEPDRPSFALWLSDMGDETAQDRAAAYAETEQKAEAAARLKRLAREGWSMEFAQAFAESEGYTSQVGSSIFNATHGEVRNPVAYMRACLAKLEDEDAGGSQPPEYDADYDDELGF